MLMSQHIGRKHVILMPNVFDNERQYYNTSYPAIPEHLNEQLKGKTISLV